MVAPVAVTQAAPAADPLSRTGLTLLRVELSRLFLSIPSWRRARAQPLGVDLESVLSELCLHEVPEDVVAYEARDGDSFSSQLGEADGDVGGVASGVEVDALGGVDEVAWLSEAGEVRGDEVAHEAT